MTLVIDTGHPGSPDYTFHMEPMRGDTPDVKRAMLDHVKDGIEANMPTEVILGSVLRLFPDLDPIRCEFIVRKHDEVLRPPAPEVPDYYDRELDPDSDPFTDVLNRLAWYRIDRPNHAMARCPAHEDSDPSLSISRTEDKALIHCFGGCHPRDVADALGMPMSDLFVRRAPDRIGNTLREARELTMPPTAEDWDRIWPENAPHEDGS